MSEEKKDEKDYKKDHEAMTKAIKKYLKAFEDNTSPQVRLAVFQNIVTLSTDIIEVGMHITDPSIGYTDMVKVKAQQAKENSPIITQ